MPYDPQLPKRRTITVRHFKRGGGVPVEEQVTLDFPFGDPEFRRTNPYDPHTVDAMRYDAEQQMGEASKRYQSAIKRKDPAGGPEYWQSEVQKKAEEAMRYRKNRTELDLVNKIRMAAGMK